MQNASKICTSEFSLVKQFRHLLRGNLHGQVATRDHDAIGEAQNGVVVDQPRLVLNLGDDLDVLAAGLVQDTADEEHVVRSLR